MKTSRQTLLAAACTLNRAFGYEPIASHRIIEELGSIGAVFSLTEEQRNSLLGPFSRFRDKLSDAQMNESLKEIDRFSEQGCQFLTIEDEGYPAALRECEDAPIFLYIRSDTPADRLFEEGPFISVVGTRDISPYGKEWTRRIVFEMSHAPSKPAVVSGMALGVDGAAHEAALESGIRTIGVLPTHIGDVYPWSHRKLADRICTTPGCALITDFPIGTTPQAATFLRRNRIIAGLSSATILIESRARGGGLITARHAFSYGRDVFVLPGRVDDIRSEGCNLLIREKIAEPITGLDMLGDALGIGTWTRRNKENLGKEVADHFAGRVGDDEMEDLKYLAGYIKTHRGISVEDISEELKWDYPAVLRLTGRLMAEGFVEMDLAQRCSIIVKNR